MDQNWWKVVLIIAVKGMEKKILILLHSLYETKLNLPKKGQREEGI